MEEFTYEQIRIKALKQGVKDNKVHIGLWEWKGYYLLYFIAETILLIH